ncbi:cytochrome c oxidase subunit 3 [uncultured Flavobacterium sp.]|jgi:nitric oxide reductase NorE protein|uniref:cytochrome c oxidase subunit 3 n=1 Tax=uncultured Flavobacterium sp. TaxID=165435 RepID=UPI002598B1D8|nr:cytochrome c oxidase subunit 3 [uncultured Flavobacterium sp.]
MELKDIKINYKNFYYPPGGILLWIIIFLELITFGMALVALVFSAKENPQLFHESSLHLNKTFGTINTIFLLASGFFVANAVHNFKENNFNKASFQVKIAMIGGLLFILLKSIEYYTKIASGFVLDTNTFFTFYWLLTGFHLIHVIVGLVILFVLNRNLKTKAIEDVEASAAFWHMCDLIWLLLFPVLYLIF